MLLLLLSLFVVLTAVAVISFQIDNNTLQITKTVHIHKGELQLGFSDQCYDQIILSKWQKSIKGIYD